MGLKSWLWTKMRSFEAWMSGVQNLHPSTSLALISWQSACERVHCEELVVRKFEAVQPEGLLHLLSNKSDSDALPAVILLKLCHRFHGLCLLEFGNLLGFLGGLWLDFCFGFCFGLDFVLPASAPLPPDEQTNMARFHWLNLWIFRHFRPPFWRSPYTKMKNKMWIDVDRIGMNWIGIQLYPTISNNFLGFPNVKN